MKCYPLVTILSLALVSCAATPRFTSHPEPTFVVDFSNHPKPAFTADFSPFEDAGCPASEYGFRHCEEDSPLADLGCDEIREAPDLVGALRPSYPLAQCLTSSYEADPHEQVDWIGVGHYAYTSEGQYFFRVGGISSFLVRYVAYIDGQFTLIETEEEFRVLFAPLESPDEALSYVQAVTGLSALFGLKQESHYVYAAAEVEDTHVDVAADGYIVHMYYVDLFGCGLHWTYTVDFHVTREGHVKQNNMKQVFRDTTLDDWCID